MSKYRAILNNYQIGSYAKRCLMHLIISEKRIDRSHSEVIWEIDNDGDLSILKNALGCSFNTKRLIKLEENDL